MATKMNPAALVIIIIILIMSNIALGTAWWCSKNANGHADKMERPSPMAAYLKKEIGFSAEQLVAFDSLRSQKRRAEKEIFGNIKKSKQEIFKNLGADHFSDSAIKTTIEFAAEKQRMLEASMMASLKEVRALCTEEQRAKFDTGFYKAFTRPAPEKK